MPNQNYPHIKITTSPVKFDFTSISSGGSDLNIPERNREQHSTNLKNQLRVALESIKSEVTQPLWNEIP